MNFTPLKEFMDRLTAWRIPGNSILVTLEGKEVFRYQSGYSDLDKQTPMQGNELFNIYSCSKVATVTAALQLYEKGFFLLDDPIYEFIPEYRELYVKNEKGENYKAKKPITMRQLFTMTSGLTYNRDTLGFKKAKELTNGAMDTLTVVKCIAEDPLAFEPGSSFLYSLSHDVLAGVVEVISGQKFRDYMKDHIFAPLEMNETVYHNAAVLDRVAPQYFFETSSERDIVKLQSGVQSRMGGHVIPWGKANSHEHGPEYDSGGAGITTSVSDYAKLVTALANWGKGANGEQILAKGTVELLRTNQLTPAQAKHFTWPQMVGYGYGLGVRTMIDKAVSGSTGNLGEFGWGGAAGATVLADPQIGLAVFYSHHMLNPQEEYYQPRLRNVVYTCLES